MDKIIPIGIGILLVIVIAAAAVLPHGGSTTPSSPTTSISTVATTIIPPSTLPRTTTIQATNALNCVSPGSTVPIYNGNFSTGTYAGWNTSGVGFGTEPANITFEDQHNGYYGHPWTGYNGTYFATSYSGGISVAEGNITSAPFLVTEPYINFKIISPQDEALYVQVLKGGKPVITVHYDTFTAPLVNSTNPTTTYSSSSNFVDASIIVVPLLCSTVQIKVVAGLVGVQGNEFNYIAATNFYLSRKPLSTPGIIVNQSLNFT
jgi:hypothetical protein